MRHSVRGRVLAQLRRRHPDGRGLGITVGITVGIIAAVGSDRRVTRQRDDPGPHQGGGPPSTPSGGLATSPRRGALAGVPGCRTPLKTRIPSIKVIVQHRAAAAASLFTAVMHTPRSARQAGGADRSDNNRASCASYVSSQTTQSFPIFPQNFHLSVDTCAAKPLTKAAAAGAVGAEDPALARHHCNYSDCAVRGAAVGAAHL